MRSQLLICLEMYRGVVIFATNLVENYDSAFETRVQHIQFQLPDLDLRKLIWKMHLPKALPVEKDLCLHSLAIKSDGLCGRDIKNVVVQTAMSAARANKEFIANSDFEKTISKIVNSKPSAPNIHDPVLTHEDKELLESKLLEAF